MAASRFRLGFKFWLNAENPQELEIVDHITHLKKSRTFAKTVRDGIRLILDLRRGKTEVLQELFPWVLEQNITAGEDLDDTPQPNTAEKLEAHIQRLEELLLHQGAVPIEQNSKPSHAPIPLKREKTSLDDLEITITQAKHNENNRSDWNFAIASAATIYGNFDALPLKIVEYGVRTGRIPADSVKHRLERATPQKPATQTTKLEPKNPKAMDVPQFAAPDFDNFDDDGLDFG